MSHILFYDKLDTTGVLLHILYLKYCGHFCSTRTRLQWMWRRWMGRQMCSLLWIPSCAVVAILVNPSPVTPAF